MKVATYLVSNYVSDLNVTYYCRLKEPIVQLLYGTKKTVFTTSVRPMNAANERIWMKSGALSTLSGAGPGRFWARYA